jgi:two-component system, LuxR family, sensor kinase FixL
VKSSGRVDSSISGSSLAATRKCMSQFGTAPASSLLTIGVIAAYVLLEWVSFIHEYKGVPITPWNPGLGLVFGFTVLFGARYAAVLFAGAVIAEIAVLRTNLWWPIILGLAAIIAGGYGLVAQVVRGHLRLDAGLNRLRDVVLLLVSGAVGAALVAVFICLLLLADHELDLADVLVAAGPLLIGDIIGIAVITPLTLRLALHPQPLLDHFSLRMLMEFLLFVAVVIATLWVIVAVGPNGSKLFYVMFLPVVVAAVRYGLDGACIGLAVTQLALVGLLHLYGYEANAFAEFQLLMLILSATGLTVGVVVTERRHADEMVRAVERELKAKELEAAQAARFNLVSGTAAALAHEINQPLTAARALARSVQQLLRGPVPDAARVGANIENLITQIDHAGGVVRRMRDFLRRGRPHSSTIVLSELLSDALALAGPEVASKGVSIALHSATDDSLVIHGDAVQLQQVTLNLVRNAAEAIADARTPNGRIRVVARRLEAPARIEISVVDNGPGITAEVAERLFHPLTTSKTDGLGLGLSISASIVEAHGGRIWLQTGRAGMTEFRFSLPLETG